MAKKQAEKFYITTPIYYPSGKWHIGTCYTTVVCDAIARFKRMQGFDVFYLTGTDEHGQKIAKSAEKVGKTPKEFVDEIVADLKDLWELLGISYDKFIRTTDEEHIQAVTKIFQKLMDSGDIYKSEYEGKYCVPCESFWTESQLVDGKCPDCGRPVESAKEASYFFRLSKYQDRILELFKSHPEFLEPKTRENEMINSFLKPGLSDLAVSRSSFKWGIPVPGDPDHVIYVWIDALSNYITALGFLSDNDSLYKKYWPADVHMMAKEIIRFHSIIWPSILMALDVPMPKKVYGHGWLQFGDVKMGKSRGNGVDPRFLSARYGVDAVRYYLLREVPFGEDGQYSTDLLLKRINSDLANTFGNLVNRTISMLNQYFGGVIPAFGNFEDVDKDLIGMAEAMLGSVSKEVDKLDIPHALESVFAVLNRANKYIDETTPWVLFKNGDKKRLATVLYCLLETIRIAAVMLSPFILDAPQKILDALNVPAKLRTFDSVKKFGQLKKGTKVNELLPLFKRIDIPKELAELAELEKDDQEVAAKASDNKNNDAAKGANSDAKAAAAESTKTEGVLTTSEIGFDDFVKVQMRVGTVTECEKMEKSDKLLKLTIAEDGKTRTILSGIAKHYAPADLVGRQVVFVANLKPRKMCGIMSEGMVLCAENKDGSLSLLTVDKKCDDGAEVS